MRDKIFAGTTSYSAPIYVTNSSTGAGLGSLVFNTSSLAAGYRRQGASTWTAISLVAGTLGTYASGGWIADNPSVAGSYEVGIPNAALASGVGWVEVMFWGAANMSPVLLYIELDAVNYQVNDLGFSGVTLPANPTANTYGEAWWLADAARGRRGTAQAGASTTITLDSGASAATNAYVGDQIILIGGTGGGFPGTGQIRTIIAYNTTTKVATVDRAWTTTPDATSTFITLPQAVSNLVMWDFAPVPTPSQAGVPITDDHYILGTASAGAPGYMGIDWAHINAPTTTVALSATTFSTSQTVAAVTGAVGSVSAAVTVGSLGAGSITTSTFASGAINATAVAANALTNIVIETGYDLAQAIQLIAAACCGTSSGVAAGSPIYNGLGNSTARITATASSGNRTGVTLTPSSI